MGNYTYFLVLLSLINIAFGIYTWKESKVTRYTRYFAGSLFFVGFWGIGLAGFLGSTSQEIALSWAKFHYIASILVPYYLLIFALSLTKGKLIKKIYRILLLLPIIAISILLILFNDLLLKEAIIEEGGNVMILFKPGHILYAVIFSLYFLATLIVLFIKLLKSSGIIRKQVILIFLGLLISGILGMIYNLILPLLGNYKLVWVGPQFTVIFLALIFLGIVKYQLFNIRLLLGKITFTITTSIIMFLGFIFFTFLNNLLFQNFMSFEYLIFGIFCAILFVFFYEKYRNFLLYKIQSKIISPGFDSIVVLKDYNTKMGKISTKNDILSQFANTIKTTLFPKYISIITRNGKEIINKQYVEYRDFNYKMIFETIEKEFDLKSRKHLALDTLVGILQNENSSSVLSLQSFIEELERNTLILLLPIVYEKELLAVCVLGKGYSSSSTYVEEEIDFLESVVNTTAVYLTRAILYEQLSQFNMSLQQKVNDQTQELQIKVKQLEEARRKEADMIDIMGHELRTPATIVKLNIELLQKYIDSNPEEFKKYLDRMSSAVETEIGLINTLLTSAKLEGDKVEIKYEKVNIKESIEMAIHGQEKDLKEGVSINTNIERNLPYAYADKIRVAEVLNNLIGNAIKYTERGSITISAKSEGTNITINVKDTGKGISKEDMEKLGEKFYRVDNYLESDIVRPGGSGLGLYVSFGLVRLMGSKIEVKSEVGMGSTFSFTLPQYTNQIIDSTDTIDRFQILGLKK